jgi:MurNAc alpha-1-phosphate uridylyltransferase
MNDNLLNKISKTAIVFAAGFGKRLGEITLKKPKPLVEIGNTNCLSLVIARLKSLGIKNILVNTHHLADQIHDFLKDFQGVGCIFEQTILETGGAVVNVLDKFEQKPFIAINGDIWFDDNNLLADLVENWNPEIMDGLLAVTEKEKTFGYKGSGDFSFHGKKLSLDTKVKDFVYTGIQILKPEIFKGYEAGSIFSLRLIYEKLSKQNSLCGYKIKGKWIDIGTPEGLEEAIK